MADCCSSSCLAQLVWYGIGRPAFEARLHRRRLQAQTCDGDRREKNVASLVIMNYSRPQMVMQLAQNYATYVCLDHILVVDCQPGRLALAASDRLTTVTITPDPGLYARFAAAALARSSPVIVIDDDLMAPLESLAALIAEWQKEPDVVHGVFGRKVDAERRYVMQEIRPPSPVSIVLTRFLAASPDLCARALANGARIVRELPGLPKGNGEDIVLSLTAMAEARKPNRIHAIPVCELLPYSDPDAISVRWPGHAEHRTAVVRWCLTHLLKR